MRRGFTLLEVAVAVAVLATAGVALERLVVQSVRTVDADAMRARTLLAARARLAEAALTPPPAGVATWTEPDGVRTTRTVSATAHPALREVRVRADDGAGRAVSEVVELVYAPAP